MSIDAKHRWRESDESRNASAKKQSLRARAQERIEECMAFDDRTKEYEIFFLEFRFIIENQDIADLYDMKQHTIYLRMIDCIKLQIHSVRSYVLSALRRMCVDVIDTDEHSREAELRRRIATATSLIDSYDHVMDVLVGDVEHFPE